MGLEQDKGTFSLKQEKQEEFKKYIHSDNSEQYYELLEKKLLDVIALLDADTQIIPLLFSLMYPGNGIKMIKVLSQLYNKYSNHDCLFRE